MAERFKAFLTSPTDRYERRAPNDPERLKRHIRKGDVLLVDGNQRVSAIIKYLTQSSWSHAALYIGDELLKRSDASREDAIARFGDEARHLVVEALMEGVVVSPLSKYVDFNVRISRPHRLRSEHLRVILDDTIASIGWRYDLRNIIDLFVYLLVVALLPGRYRRRVLQFGSGTSTEVICTSLLGRLFHKVGFPVLPSVVRAEADGEPTTVAPKRPWLALRAVLKRRSRIDSPVYRKRHPTLLTPRDFDLSPFFEIVKFNVQQKRGFDYTSMRWADDGEGHPQALDTPGDGDGDGDELEAEGRDAIQA